MDMKQELSVMLIEKLGLNLNPADIQADQSIQELGMDSLALVKLLYLLEDDYGISLKTEEVLAVNTFGDLMSMLEAKLGSRTAAV